MKKPLVMALLGAGLVAGYFFMARRASAATADSGVANLPAGSAAGAAAAGATGATGALPAELTFPGGGSQPIAFEGSAPIPGVTSSKVTPSPYTSMPAPRTASPAAPGGNARDRRRTQPV